MTWLELANRILNEMVPEQQQQDITVHIQSSDEFFPATLDMTGEEPDVLDPNSYFLDVEG